jgi:hypothetical protein
MTSPLKLPARFHLGGKRYTAVEYHCPAPRQGDRRFKGKFLCYHVDGALTKRMMAEVDVVRAWKKSQYVGHIGMHTKRDKLIG